MGRGHEKTAAHNMKPTNEPLRPHAARIPAFVDRSDLSTSQYRVYGFLAHRANQKTLSVCVSLDEIAAGCGVCRMTAVLAINALIASFLIAKVPRGADRRLTYELLPAPKPLPIELLITDDDRRETA